MTKQAAVIGMPISHSLSPMIFSFISNALGIKDFQYQAIEIKPEELHVKVADLKRTPNMIGFNVTLPHKQTIFSELDATSPEANAIGAVNVVHFDDGRLIGYNTDVIGIKQTFQDHSKIDLSFQNVFLFGAGGAARAVCFALGELGLKKVYICNRNLERAEKLCVDFNKIFSKTLFSALSTQTEQDLPTLEEFSLVVNATSVGLDLNSSKAAFDPLKKIKFKQDALAFDLIYNHEWTPFLSEAKKLGLITTNGLDLLIGQAIAAWKIWFNDHSSLEKLTLPLRFILKGEPIFLTGFMGSGKSTVGASLAQKLGWDFIDTDQVIEKNLNLSVVEIFKNNGEQAFRELEKEVIVKLGPCKRTVISLGGGSLTNPETLKLVRNSGVLVYLSAKIETLSLRLKVNGYKRPLLAGLENASLEEQISTLLNERSHVYNQAILKISTDHFDPERIAEEIFSQLVGAQK